MNNRFIKIISLVASSAIFASGCGDTSSLETPNTNIDTTLNSGVISQNNFTILSSDLTPSIFADPASNTFTFTELDITVRIGDRNNQVLTDAHTVFFKTEWGLIQPSCVTENGTCSVTWQTSSGDEAPDDHKNTIMAYSIGEESFTDTNGDAIFDDSDSIFADQEEPYVDSNRNLMYDTGEPVKDVVNGNDPTGTNGEHDFGDSFFNGNGCTHASLCSESVKTIYVWDDVQINMDGPPTAL